MRHCLPVLIVCYSLLLQLCGTAWQFSLFALHCCLSYAALPGSSHCLLSLLLQLCGTAWQFLFFVLIVASAMRHCLAVLIFCYHCCFSYVTLPGSSHCLLFIVASAMRHCLAVLIVCYHCCFSYVTLPGSSHCLLFIVASAMRHCLAVLIFCYSSLQYSYEPLNGSSHCLFSLLLQPCGTAWQFLLFVIIVVAAMRHCLAVLIVCSSLLLQLCGTARQFSLFVIHCR